MWIRPVDTRWNFQLVKSQQMKDALHFGWEQAKNCQSELLFISNRAQRFTFNPPIWKKTFPFPFSAHKQQIELWMKMCVDCLSEWFSLGSIIKYSVWLNYELFKCGNFVCVLFSRANWVRKRRQTMCWGRRQTGCIRKGHIEWEQNTTKDS